MEATALAPAPQTETPPAPGPDSGARPEELFARHYAMSQQIADHLSRRLPDHLSRDDIRQEAAVGLWDAARRFDPARNVSFAAFAGRRVTGRVLDYVREADHLSRAHRQDVKAGRAFKVEYKSIHGIDSERLSDRRERQSEIIEARDTFAELCRRVRPKVRQVLFLRVDGLTMKQIGERVGRSESMVSMMFTEAIHDGRRHMPGHVVGEPVRENTRPLSLQAGEKSPQERGRVSDEVNREAVAS